MASDSLRAYLPNLPFHLSEAGDTEGLTELLFDFDWLKGQVDRANVSGAVADCNLLVSSREADSLRRSLLLARDPLLSEPRQLAHQLLGRLSPTDGSLIESLLQQAEETMAGKSWIRPVARTLHRPDEALQWVVQPSSAPIDALASLEDGGFACVSEGVVQIWTAEHERREPDLRLDDANIVLLVLVGDNHLLTGADNGRINLWDIESLAMTATYTGHSSAIVALEAREQEFVAAGSDGSLVSWNLESSTPAKQFSGHTNDVRDLAFVNERLFASVSKDRTLRLWDLKTGRQTHQAVLPVLPGELVARWKKNHVLTGTFAGEVHIWKIRKRAIHRVKTLRYSALGLRFLAVLDSDLGVSGAGGSNGIRSWKPSNGQVGDEIYVQGGEVVSGARVGKTTVLCGTKQGYVSRVEIAVATSGSAAASDDVESGRSLSQVYSVVAIENLAATSSGQGTVRIWNPNSGIELRTLKGGGNWISSIAILRDGMIASAESGATEIRIWDPRKGQLVSVIETGKTVGFLSSFTPDALAVAPSVRGVKGSEDDAGKTIDLWDTRDPRRARLMVSLPKIPASIGTMICFDGRFMVVGVVGEVDNYILHLDLSTYEDRRNFRLSAHSKGVVSLEFLGRDILASGSLDTTIRLWNLKRRECVGTLEGHGREVTGLVHIDDRLLASASQDQTIRIWDIDKRTTIHRVDCDAGLHCLAITPDRRVLIAGDARGQVHFLGLENIPAA